MESPQQRMRASEVDAVTRKASKPPKPGLPSSMRPDEIAYLYDMSIPDDVIATHYKEQS